MKANQRTCQHRLAHVLVERGGQAAVASTSPEAKRCYSSAASPDNVLPPFHADWWGKDSKTATGT